MPGTKKTALYTDTAVSPSLVQEPLSHILPQPDFDKRGRIRCPLMNNGAGGWRQPKPEERVRQGYILHLQQHYGYAFEQMLDEQRTQHGHRSPKADIVTWESPAARNSDPRPSPKIVVECKAETIDIHPRDFYQGESYARAVAADLLVMHNERQTHIFKVVPGLPGELVQINELPKASDWGDAQRIEEIKNSLRVFNRKEFQDLLFKCHSILRDVHKMEPGNAFDAISKVLFIKMYIERTGTWGTFSTDYLDQTEKLRLPNAPEVHDQLFELTKRFYARDEIFSDRDKLEISKETFRRLVKELQRFNLSATSDDIKGLAFERFLGATFRGNLGQFFTPRPVVNFIVDLLDPEEGELICDPAAGSGGFLIRAFEHTRGKIEDEIQQRRTKPESKLKL
jgi:type I restriction enzyme M protein